MDFNQVKVRLKQTSGDQNQWKVQRFRWAGFGLLKTCIIPWILKVSKFPFNLFILFKKISLIWYPRLPYSTSTNTYGAQCPRTDFNKRFLPRTKTIIAWKLIPHRSKSSKNWNPLWWVPLYRTCKNWFLLIQKQLYSNYI